MNSLEIGIEDKEFLTIHEARSFLGVSRSYLYMLMGKKKVQPYALGRKTYLKKSDLINVFTPKPEGSINHQ